MCKRRHRWKRLCWEGMSKSFFIKRAILSAGLLRSNLSRVCLDIGLGVGWMSKGITAFPLLPV